MLTFASKSLIPGLKYRSMNMSWVEYLKGHCSSTKVPRLETTLYIPGTKYYLRNLAQVMSLMYLNLKIKASIFFPGNRRPDSCE